VKYIYRFSAKSTNAVAAHCGSTSPFVIYTYRQTAGKGMGKNSWFTGRGCNIAMSVCFTPTFIKPDEQFLLNMILSCALRNAIQTLIPDKKVYLKWSNDIYISDKKLAGILFENKISGNGEFSKSIMGIGINVNQKQFPVSLPNPVSMRIATGRQFCKKKVINAICTALENAYNKTPKTWAEAKKEYISHLLYYGIERNFIYKDIPITGKIVDVDNFGRLLISVTSGFEMPDGGLGQPNSAPLVCDIKEVKMPPSI
jgi:BirA family biotin operon repressor/biotin-[acetyl-CoA-carboxylase] ligase